MFRDVAIGVLAAISFSLVVAVVFLVFYEGLAIYQELFEGIIMLLAAGILTWMIFWMIKQSRGIKSEFEEKIDEIMTSQQKTGIVLLVFFSVAREGVELVLFLYASYVNNVPQLGMIESLLGLTAGFIIGLIIACTMAVILFTTTRQLNLRVFFRVTSVILVVFAAGLVAHGIHEIYEFLVHSGSGFAQVFIWTEAWNINNTPLGEILKLLFNWTYDPAYPLRFEKSIVGGILTGLFGWNDNPALIEVTVYLGYYIIIAAVMRLIKNGNRNNKLITV